MGQPESASPVRQPLGNSIGPTVEAPGARLASRQAGASGLVCVEVTDLAGISRCKAIPLRRLREAAEQGIAAPVFAFFGVDDHIVEISGRQPATLESRLVPDAAAIVPLWGSPGLAWVPADQRDPDMAPLDTCPRSFLKSRLTHASRLGITFIMAFEVEFTLFSAEGVLAHNGPGYGARVITEHEGFIGDLVTALAEQGLQPEQFHAEYSPGQCEVTVAPLPALQAADAYLLLRLTIRRVARMHGLQVSFAPVPADEGLANGTHLHWSAWRDGASLLTTGPGTGHLGPPGDSLTAGMLIHLPELLAITAPSVLSYRRLQPRHWAGAFRCWGFGNREAALRVVRGPRTSQGATANVEVKSIDGAANPYLAAGALIGSALAGLDEGLELPEPVQTDPALLPQDQRAAGNITRLPSSLGEAIQLMDSSKFIHELLGSELHDFFLAVRKDELERLGSLPAEQLIDFYRYKY
jgi:glutamine synthetase